MKPALTFLAALLLAPVAALHGDGVTWGRVDSVPFVGGKEGYAVYRCPTLAVSTNGTVLAFCEGRVNSHQDEDDMDVVLKRSTDGGRTWGPLQVLANDGKNPCKNQCPVEPRGCQASLLFRSLNPATGKGNILFSNPANATVRSDGTLKLSEDDGHTWTRAFRYARKPAPNFTGYSDIAVMPDGSVGILHKGGDLRQADSKKERYDEVGFIVVPFAEIRTPLPTTPTKASTE